MILGLLILEPKPSKHGPVPFKHRFSKAFIMEAYE